MATDAEASPRPATIMASSPPKECPMTAGVFDSLPITSAYRSAICPIVLPAKTSGCAFASSTVSGSFGHPGVSAA
jgi:hypothetical protein